MAELQTQIILAAEMNYLTKETEAELIKDAEEVFRMIYGLREKLKPSSSAKTSRLKALS